MNAVTLPWPRPAMRPNGSHGHWTTKHRAARADKADAYTLCIAEGVRAIAADRLDVALTFRPPTARKRDLDNALAQSKALLDGVSQALGVDDSRWRLTLEMGEPVKGGAVVVKWRIVE